MNILHNLEESINLNRLNNMHYEFVKNAFMANYFAALIFIKFQDLKGLKIVNDPQHAKLKKWSNNMSDLNFWGKTLFNSKDKEVVQRLLPGHAKNLERESSRILDSRVQAIMKVPMTEPHMINWTAVVAMLQLLKYRFEITSSYCTRIISMIYRWSSLTDNEKKKLVYLTFAYLQQSDANSKSLTRLRALNNDLQLHTAEFPRKVIAVVRMNEDDGGGAGTVVGNVGSSGNAIIGGSSMQQSTSGSVNKEMDLGGLYRLDKKSPWQVTKTVKVGKFVFRGGKPIKKKVKRWNPIKFKAPDHMKPQKSGDKDA